MIRWLNAGQTRLNGIASKRKKPAEKASEKNPGHMVKSWGRGVQMDTVGLPETQGLTIIVNPIAFSVELI